jgi:hypothetical protein
MSWMAYALRSQSRGPDDVHGRAYVPAVRARRMHAAPSDEHNAGEPLRLPAMGADAEAGAPFMRSHQKRLRGFAARMPDAR